VITGIYGSTVCDVEAHDGRRVVVLLPFNEDAWPNDLHLDADEARSLAAALLAAADASEATL